MLKKGYAEVMAEGFWPRAFMRKVLKEALLLG